MSVRSVFVGIVPTPLASPIATVSPAAIPFGAAVIITKEPVTPFPFADLVTKRLKAGTAFFEVRPTPLYFSAEIQEFG